MNSNNETTLNLSIIILSYNTSGLLRDCLQSLSTNTPPATEIIVVDNASSDDSVSMVERSFPRVRLIRNKSNLGFAAANNQGIKVATGRFLLLLNSDTIVTENSLSSMTTFLESNPLYGACACRLLNADGTLQVSAYRIPSLLNIIIHSTIPLRRLFPGLVNTYPSQQFETDFDAEYLSGACLLVSSNAIAAVGALDDNFFFYAEDVDWCKRIRKEFNIRYLHKPAIIHLCGGSTKGGTVSLPSRWSQKQHRRSLLLFARKHYKITGLILMRGLFVIGFFLNTGYHLIQLLRGRDSRREWSSIQIGFELLFTPVGGRE
ncbi:MAG TPA: glycosyl transferase family 2 [Bdellovibrionales bacterium]|nr:glycosyl transferase family 2 [Bdellovibrionales bacterium]